MLSSLRSRKPLVITLITSSLTLAACGGGDSDNPPTAAADRCATIKAGDRLNDATVTGSRLVAATSTVPEHCEILGTLPTKTRWAVRMPSAWNDRTLYTGGGGFNGNLAGANASALAQGMVHIASTGGNDVPNNAEFALDAVALNDFSYLSVHRTSEVAKRLISTFYKTDAKRNYFEGCSNGGREGLMAAQRFPQDFDGIIARAPVVSYTNTLVGFVRTRQALVQPQGNFTSADITLLNNAVLAACDGQDGLVDKIIGRPEQCTFNPASLRCNGSNAGACLSDNQLATIDTLYNPYTILNKPTALGFNLGSEANWDGSQTGAFTASLPRYTGLFSEQWVKNFVAQNAAADVLTFDPVVYDVRMNTLRAMMDIVNPDLAAFKARGGKLLVYHGLADAATSARASVKYYQQAVENMGGQSQADSVLKLYLNPGVGHCSGGTGPDTVNLLAPLQEWVENGTDPTGLIATKIANGVTTFSRPLCEYPKYPRYNGSGDVNSSANYTCTAP